MMKVDLRNQWLVFMCWTESVYMIFSKQDHLYHNAYAEIKTISEIFMIWIFGSPLSQILILSSSFDTI